MDMNELNGFLQEAGLISHISFAPHKKKAPPPPLVMISMSNDKFFAKETYEAMHNEWVRAAEFSAQPLSSNALFVTNTFHIGLSHAALNSDFDDTQLRAALHVLRQNEFIANKFDEHKIAKSLQKALAVDVDFGYDKTGPVWRFELDSDGPTAHDVASQYNIAFDAAGVEITAQPSRNACGVELGFPLMQHETITQNLRRLPAGFLDLQHIVADLSAKKPVIKERGTAVLSETAPHPPAAQNGFLDKVISFINRVM